MGMPENGSAPTGQDRGARGQSNWNGFHAQNATAEPLLQRLEGVQKSGNGWRAKCPACGGQSRKVSIAERDGQVLLHCFGGCKSIVVLEAVGLAWADIMPPRTWPQSPEERRRARCAIREAGWTSALEVLAVEAQVVFLAAHDVHYLGGLRSHADLKRLREAVDRIAGAKVTLCEVRR